jgi:hypothetical protein
VNHARRANERLLLALVRRADPGLELAVERDEAAWHDLLLLLRQHRLTAFARRALSARPELLPREVYRRLWQASAHSSLLNAAIARDGERVLRALDAGSVPVVPMKGPWLAEEVGAGFDERPTGDLDLLVPEWAAGRAAAELAGLGCLTDSDGSGGLPLHTRFAPAGGELWTARVELHCRLFEDDSSSWMGRLWRRAQRRRWRTVDTWAMSPADLVLMLAVHSYRHGWANLCHGLDLAMAVSAKRGRLDWDVVVAQAREARIASIVGRSLTLANTLCAADVPLQVLRSLDQAPLRRLAAGALIWRSGGVLRPRLRSLTSGRRLLAVPYPRLLTLVCEDDPVRRALAAGRAWQRVGERLREPGRNGGRQPPARRPSAVRSK